MNRGRSTAVLCASGNLLLLLLASTVLTVVLVLASIDSFTQFWTSLGLHGLFVFLAVLVSAAVSCGFQQRLLCAGRSAADWRLFVLIQIVVALLSMLVVIGAEWLRPLELSAHADPLFFILRNLGISMVVSALLLRYFALQSRWKAQVEAETGARMKSLQARIRPHFLFNALNTISSLIHDKPDEAEQATMDLSDLLRTGLSDAAYHSLGEELDLVRGYLRIESLRLGDRFKVEWALADDLPLEVEMPALMIQPLVENGVVHGIARLPRGGTLHIRGEWARRNRLRFVIDNPVPEDDDAGSVGNQMALDNIRQRLELAYEEGARLKTQQEDGRFRAELIVPIHS